MRKELLVLIFGGLVCVGCANNPVIQDFNRRVQQAAEFSLANGDLIAGHTEDHCPSWHFNWKGSFAVIFDAPIEQEAINFWGRLIQAHGGTVTSQGNMFDVYVFLTVRGTTLEGKLFVVGRGQDMHRLTRRDIVALNQHLFSLEKPWRGFTYRQQVSIMNAVAPFMVNTACANGSRSGGYGIS